MPAAYFSRQLQGAQHNYSATELEGLAIFKSVHFFCTLSLRTKIYGGNRPQGSGCLFTLKDFK